MIASQKKFVLALGGIDPSGFAGLFADARTFLHFHIPAHAIVTALTAQSETKFYSWKEVEPSFLQQQLDAVPSPFGVKLGMLGTLRNLKIVLAWVKKNPPRYLLWDPVLRSTTGYPLLKIAKPTREVFSLLRETSLFTPNIPEAEWFLERKIRSLDEMKSAAKQLQSKMRPKGIVLLKGGHLSDSKQKKFSIDLYYDGKKTIPLRAKRRHQGRRGTGCSFGAAWLAGLWRGQEPLAAARSAKRYVLKHVIDA